MHLISEHEKKCSIGNYKCPFSTTSNFSCSPYCRLDDLKRHVLRDHDGSNLDDYGHSRFYSRLRPMTPNGSFAKALVVFGELFYAVWRVKEGQLRCTVMYIGPENNCSNYTYRFTVTSSNKGETISMCLVTQSYTENLDDVLKPGNCIAISYDIIQRFLVKENMLPFRFDICRLGEAHNGLPLKEHGDTQCDEL
jgi:hypothetical protein